MRKEVMLTQESYNELKKELEYMKTEGARSVAEAIKEARGYGDLSENSEYDEAKNEQGKLYSRIAEIEAMLEHAVIISEDEKNSHLVRMGVDVTVLFVANGMKKTFSIVGTQEVDIMNNKISNESPIGKALVGKAVGDHAVAETPAGQMELEILQID